MQDVPANHRIYKALLAAILFLLPTGVSAQEVSNQALAANIGTPHSAVAPQPGVCSGSFAFQSETFGISWGRSAMRRFCREQAVARMLWDFNLRERARQIAIWQYNDLVRERVSKQHQYNDDAGERK